MDISYIINELGEERDPGDAGGGPAEGQTLDKIPGKFLIWTSLI